MSPLGILLSFFARKAELSRPGVYARAACDGCKPEAIDELPPWRKFYGMRRDPSAGAAGIAAPDENPDASWRSGISLSSQHPHGAIFFRQIAHHRNCFYDTATVSGSDRPPWRLSVMKQGSGT